MKQPLVSTDDPRATAAMSYALGFLTGAIVLWRAPEHPFVRFHAWQSILFSAALLTLILALDLVPLLGLGLVLALGAGGAVVWVFLLVQAWRGRWFALPLLGDVAFERAGVER